MIFIFLLFIYIFVYLTISKHVNSYINFMIPVIGFQVIQSVIAPLLGVFLGTLKINYVDYEVCLALIIYNLTIVLGIKLKKTKVEQVVFNIWDYLDFTTNKKKLLRTSFVLIIILTFLVMGVSSIGVISIIKNPRNFYQFHREGIGAFYSLYVSTILLLELYTQYTVKNKRKKIFFLFICLIFLYFSASKEAFVYAAFIFIFFYDLKHKLKFKHLIIIAFVMIFLMGVLMIAQGTASSISGIISYFDYYYNTRLFFEKILNEGELFHGEIFTSSFYKYIPRGIIESKPKVYGSILIQEMLFPGLAESNHYPAFMGIVYNMGDFGFFELFIKSFILGISYGLKFSYYNQRKTFWSLVIYMSNFYAIFWLFGGWMNYFYWMLICFLMITINTIKYLRRI